MTAQHVQSPRQFPAAKKSKPATTYVSPELKARGDDARAHQQADREQIESWHRDGSYMTRLHESLARSRGHSGPDVR